MSLSLPPKTVEFLHKAVLASLPSENILGRWVEFKLALRLDDIRRADSTLPDLVLHLFYWIEMQRKWPAFLEAGIEEFNPDLPVLREACQQIQVLAAAPTRTAIGGDTTTMRELLIWDDAPFVDRISFWIDIEELLTSAKKRVILVNGPPRAGKSYCADLLDHLRRCRWTSTTLALIDLKDVRSRILKPDELCRRLLLKLKPGTDTALLPPLPDQKPDRWAADLAIFLSGQIAQVGGDVWVVLDGFNHPDVPEETHVFICTLAAEAGDQGHFRVVLLDYDQVFGDRTERSCRRTRIGYLTASDLDEFLTLLDKRHGVASKPGWAAAKAFVDCYALLPSGSATQVDALKELFPNIVQSLLK